MAEEKKKPNTGQQQDYQYIVANIEKIKKLKAEKKVGAGKTPKYSTKPLKIEPSELDSPLKQAIVAKINEKNLTYGDMYRYCTKVKNGNVLEGQRFGYNVIACLRTRHTMIDTTLSMLCDFLNLRILFVDSEPEDEVSEEESEETVEDEEELA